MIQSFIKVVVKKKKKKDSYIHIHIIKKKKKIVGRRQGQKIKKNKRQLVIRDSCFGKNDNSFHGYQHETREHKPIVRFIGCH